MNSVIRGSRLVLIVLIALLATYSIASAQVSAFTVEIISIDSDLFPLVKAYVSISDAQGFPITGLDSSAFLLSEDNQPVTSFGVTAYNNTEQPLAIVLVLDTSGSMAGTPLINSIEAVRSFTSTLMPSDQVALVTFATEPALIQELTPEHDKINVALEGIKAEGDTALYDAIVEATSILKNRSERRVIVLMTDGKETGISQFSFDQAVNEAVRWSTPIYPIGFGGIDKAELERLAKLTGGFAQINPDSTTLSSAFTNVLNNLREQYLIEYPSTLRADGLEHDLDITVDYQNGTASARSKFVAKPGEVSLSLPDYPDGSEISGTLKFKPGVLAPAPLERVDILINEQPLTNILGVPFEYIWDSTSVAPGEYKFEFIATDMAGNSGSLDVRLIVIPPVSVTTGIAAEQVISGVFSITAAVEAPAGIAKVEFFVDDQKIGEAKSPPFDIEWDTTRISPGFHELIIKASDVNGYSGEERVKVNVNIQKSSNLIWLAVIVILVASAIIIPIAFRRNKRKKLAPAGLGETGKGQLAGQFQAVLVEKEGINPGQRWNLFEKDVHLGRKKEENDIPLKGLKASRHQAIISKRSDGYVLTSINSENPMIVNGSPSPGEIILAHGDLIQAGDSEFVFELQNPE